MPIINGILILSDKNIELEIMSNGKVREPQNNDLDIYDVLPDYSDYVAQLEQNASQFGWEFDWKALKDTICDFGQFPYMASAEEIDKISESVAKKYFGLSL